MFVEYIMLITFASVTLAFLVEGIHFLVIGIKDVFNKCYL
jgi:hypothetical protein